MRKKHSPIILAVIIFMSQGYMLYREFGWTDISFSFFPTTLYLVIQAFIIKDVAEDPLPAIQSKLNIFLVIVAIFSFMFSIFLYAHEM
jgi:hypothetical protein